jgi:hypothetical protein
MSSVPQEQLSGPREPVTARLCQLCGADEVSSFHHLIPRTLHANRWFKARYTREELRRGIDVCRTCHSMIHELISEKQLGRQFGTLEALAAHPKLSKYIAWKRRRQHRDAAERDF